MKARLIYFLVIVSVTIVSCKKFIFSDLNLSNGDPPVITINGGNSYSQPAPAIPGNGVWTNPTATANDVVDGDVSSTILVFNTVDPNVTGTYLLYYTAHDHSNNYNTDTVTVTITAGPHVAPYLAGVYNANDTCSLSGMFTYSSTWTCDAVINNKVTINNFGGFGSAINVICTVNTTNQTLNFTPPITLGPSASATAVSGSYTHNGNSVQVTMAYTWTDGTAIESCVSHYNK